MEREDKIILIRVPCGEHLEVVRLNDEESKSSSSLSNLNSAAPKSYQFFGSYAHSIDEKGRLIVPNSYRDALGKPFTIGPTRDFQGIALYPDDVYDQLLADIVSMNQRKPVVQKFAMQFSKLTYREIQPDSQGRLLLPAKLRQRMLGDAKELEISGALDYIRVVSSEKADDEDMFFTDNQEEILEQLGNLDG